METHKIEIKQIVMPKGRRPLRQSIIDDLADSIGEIGLRTPISVRMVNGVPHLITGRHRVMAMQARNRTLIDAYVFDDDEAARVWEIDENLQRADLTSTERGNHIRMRSKLIEARAAGQRAKARELPPASQQFATRDAAKVAGQRYYYPPRPCSRGHDGIRYVLSGHCVECERARAIHNKRARDGEKGLSKPRQNAEVLTGGRGVKGGNSEVARQLGVSERTVRRAKMFDNLMPGAKAEALRLGIANQHHALRHAAGHDTEALQIRALNSQVKRLAEKAERKRREQMTIREQAAAAVGAAPRLSTGVDYAMEMTTSYWLWLIEEFGERAYQIINRLREVDPRLLFEIADKAKAEGMVPKPRLH